MNSTHAVVLLPTSCMPLVTATLFSRNVYKYGTTLYKSMLPEFSSFCAITNILNASSNCYIVQYSNNHLHAHVNSLYVNVKYPISAPIYLSSTF